MTPLVITACSNRKRHMPSEDLCARNLPKGILEQTAERWWAHVETAGVTHFAKDLYCGRGFREAVLASEVNASPLYVISAGLGLVHPDQQIPAYDLTLSRTSEDFIKKKIIEPINDAEWWSAANETHGTSAPIADLIHEHTSAVVLIAGSEGYFRLISEDLCSLNSVDQLRLRIFGPQDLSAIPKRLHTNVMPYVESFDGPDSPIPGTKSDFAQRALRHFVEQILPMSSSINDPERHRKAINLVSADWQAPAKIQRVQKSDEQIIELVQSLWTRAKGGSGRMLRILRDEEQVACEQGRFAALFKQAKEKYSLESA